MKKNQNSQSSKQENQVELVQTTKAIKGSQNIEPFVDIHEVAKKTGMTEGSIIKARRQFGLPYYKVGARVFFRVSEVDVWLKQRRVAG